MMLQRRDLGAGAGLEVASGKEFRSKLYRAQLKVFKSEGVFANPAESIHQVSSSAIRLIYRIHRQAPA
jgi:hypothetical protein